MIPNHILEDIKADKNDQKDNLKKKILILLLLPTLTLVSLIIFINSFKHNYQNNIHVDQEKTNKNINYDERSDDLNVVSNIEIETFPNEKPRILDTQINKWTLNDQRLPKVSSLSDGSFVVVWQSYLEDGSGWGIYGQIFYSNGAKKGNEFPITNNTTLNQTNPNVAASSKGKFMVIWQQSDGNVFGQMFINYGTKLRGLFQINTMNNPPSQNPSITKLTKNNFVVTWEDSNNIYVQIMTDDGNTKIIQQFNISSPNHLPYFPSITSLVNGNIIVTYRGSNVYAQIFYENGTLLKSEFPVNPLGHATSVSINSISTSNFMIVWSSQSQVIGSDYDIYGQSFASSGIKIGNEFRINTYIIGDQKNPSITSLANDNYIVTWNNNNQYGSGYGIYGQILDSTGNKIGSQFKVNTYRTDAQQFPSVSSLINTNFVVVWENYAQDSSIFGNIYQSDGSIINFNKCPLNCQSCDSKTNCTTCDPNFTIRQNGLCGCLDGFYLNNISASICISKLIISNYLLKFHSRLSQLMHNL